MFSFRNPAAWRRPFPDVYRDELGLITHAEELGFDTIWLTEHHFADDGYSPSIIPLAAASRRGPNGSASGSTCCCCRCTTPSASPRTSPRSTCCPAAASTSGSDRATPATSSPATASTAASGSAASWRASTSSTGLWTQRHVLLRRRALPDRRRPSVPKPVQQPMPPLWIGATSQPGRPPRRPARRQPARADEPAAAGRLRAGPGRGGLRSRGRQGAAAPLDARRRRPTTRRGTRRRRTSTTCSRCTRSGWSRPTIPATGSPAPRSRTSTSCGPRSPCLFMPVFGAP